MGGCSHEAHEHGHSCDHDSYERGVEFSLYQSIDIPHVRCLNEAVDDSCQKVFKAWDDRFDLDIVSFAYRDMDPLLIFSAKFVKSDCDEQLIVFIPFTGSVKLKSIAIFSEPGSDENPSKMKAFMNREDIDFDSVESTKADQEWDLIRIEGKEMPEYPCKLTKFMNVRNLTLYFPENYGDEITKITYIGLKGEFKPIGKDPIITLYESAANPADHPEKVKSATTSSHMIQ